MHLCTFDIMCRNEGTVLESEYSPSKRVCYFSHVHVCAWQEFPHPFPYKLHAYTCVVILTSFHKILVLRSDFAVECRKGCSVVHMVTWFKLLQSFVCI